MKKRILSLILCISMLCGVLVGCGGNSSSENTEQNTQQNTEQNTQLSTEQNSEVVEEVKYYSVSEEDLEHSLYKVWDIMENYYRALHRKEIYGYYPDSPADFIKGCTENRGNLTILQQTNSDIIFTENFVNKQDQGAFYSIYDKIYENYVYTRDDRDCYTFVDIVYKNFEGNFIYKEGTRQVIKVIMDYDCYLSNTTPPQEGDDEYENLYVVYLTKEAGNTDVWLINDMKHYPAERTEGGHSVINDSRYLNSVLAQEDFTLLVNEDSDNIDVGNTGYNAYIEYIKSEFSDYLDAYYNMADFDGDGFKEVIYNGEAGDYLLAYYDGKVIKNELPYYGDIMYKSKKNILVQQAEPARGSGATVYFHLENGNIVVDNKASYFIDDELNETTYYLNDNPISKEEYDKYYIVNYDEWGYFGDARYFNEIVSEFSR